MKNILSFAKTLCLGLALTTLTASAMELNSEEHKDTTTSSFPALITCEIDGDGRIIRINSAQELGTEEIELLRNILVYGGNDFEKISLDKVTLRIENGLYDLGLGIFQGIYLGGSIIAPAIREKGQSFCAILLDQYHSIITEEESAR